jgi:phosphoribosylanthranilate isomerase
MLKTFVKVSEITNLSDARYCAGMGVELLGFCMDETSPEYVSPEKFEEIKSWVAGVQLVGETQSADYQVIKQFLEVYKIDFLQISEPKFIPEITNFGKPIILNIDFDSAYLKENLEKYSKYVEIFLISGEELSDLARYEMKEIAQNYNVLLGFGISENNINELLEEILVKGIIIPANDFDKLRDILEVLEIDS